MLPALLAFIHAGLWLVLLGNLWYLHRRRLPEEPASRAGPLPKISVLVPARNEARNLRRLLPSLFEQNYPHFEVIVYNDGSEDGTAEVLRSFREQPGGQRLKVLQGDGPPSGWVGKPHALFQATRPATGDHYLFLDADARLEDAGALRRLERRFRALPPATVLTGFPRLRGGGLLLVSIVPHAILTGLPWPLVHRLPPPSLGALNGQCWMIEAGTYHRHEPHRTHADEVLEDVKIGHYLKSKGVMPQLCDVRREISIFMYDSFGGAWRGFRKNAYLLMGGTWLRAVLFIVLFALTFVLAPLFAPLLLASLYGLKALTDLRAGLPLWLPLLAPLCFILAVTLQIDSTLHHLAGHVRWKGRPVGSSSRKSA